MLDPRHDFLPDIAALVEIDAGELVHVGFVREGIAVAEIVAAARHAKRDAVRVITRRLAEAGAEIGGGLLGKMRRQYDAEPKRRQPRVGGGEPVFAFSPAVPDP